MLARHAVLLTPSESALSSCLPFCKQRVAVTPLFVALTRTPQIAENKTTLSLLLAIFTDFAPVTPVFATLTENAGVYTNSSHSGARHSPLATRHSSLGTRHFFSSEARQSLRFFASISPKTQNPPFCFQHVAHSSALRWGWGVGARRHHPSNPICRLRSLPDCAKILVPAGLYLSPEHAPAGSFCNRVPRKEGQTL
jgi:hypothetical protein